MTTTAQLSEAQEILTSTAQQFTETPTADTSMLDYLAMEMAVSSWLPAGSLVSEVLSALLDELPPFQEIFDNLAGNGDAISAHAEQVRAAGKAMQSDVIPDMAQATSSVRRTWQGDAADAFTQNSEALIGTCSAYVPITDRIAELELAIGAHVGEIRNLCRDTMADCLVSIWDEAAKVGLATVVGASVGAGAGAMIGTVVAGPVGTIIGSAIGALTGGTAAAAAEFIPWMLNFLFTYLQYFMQVLQDMLSLTTNALGQITGLADGLHRAACVLRGEGDPGPAVGAGTTEGSFADRWRGTEHQQGDLALAAINEAFPGWEPVTDPATGNTYVRLTEEQIQSDPDLKGLLPYLTDDGTGFAAGIYVVKDANGELVVENGKPQIVVTMGGTTDGPSGTEDFSGTMKDVVEDGAGGVTVSGQVGNAMALSQKVQELGLNDNTVYTGHSLGGRLATVAGATSGVPSVTYNAAGISEPTIDYIAAQRGMTADQLHQELNAGGGARTYYATDDPLNIAQQGLHGMHNAEGTQHVVPGQPGGGPIGGHKVKPLLDSMYDQYYPGTPVDQRLQVPKPEDED